MRKLLQIIKRTKLEKEKMSHVPSPKKDIDDILAKAKEEDILKENGIKLPCPLWMDFVMPQARECTHLEVRQMPAWGLESNLLTICPHERNSPTGYHV